MTRLELNIANRTTVDFLPQAQGSWAELNNKRQAINNQALGVGVILFLSALFGVSQLFVLNYYKLLRIRVLI